MTQKIDEEIESIIELCKSVKSGVIDPFSVDVDYILSIIRKHYPTITDIKEICLDAEAIKELSNVLEQQNEWIQHQSTTLYKDPFFLYQQLILMDISATADIFLKSWHPLICLEQASSKTLTNALRYWEDLLPIADRWKESESILVDANTTTWNDAIKYGLVLEGRFAETIENLWQELREAVGEGGSKDYWDWIGRDSYKETLERAYLTCFLVGYGYATLVTDRFGENIRIVHKIDPYQDSRDNISLPLLIDYEEWKRWQRN